MIFIFIANKYNTNYMEDDEDQEKGNNNAFDELKFIKISDFNNTSSTLFVNSTILFS